MCYRKLEDVENRWLQELSGDVPGHATLWTCAARGARQLCGNGTTPLSQGDARCPCGTYSPSIGPRTIGTPARIRARSSFVRPVKRKPAPPPPRPFLGHTHGPQGAPCSSVPGGKPPLSAVSASRASPTTASRRWSIPALRTRESYEPARALCGRDSSVAQRLRRNVACVSLSPILPLRPPKTSWNACLHRMVASTASR